MTTAMDIEGILLHCGQNGFIGDNLAMPSHPGCICYLIDSCLGNKYAGYTGIYRYILLV